MSKDRFYLKAAVYIILERDTKVLFLRRFQTGWMDGHYTLPAGHLDGGESPSVAMARECQEETGIKIRSSDLEVIHTMHRISRDAEYVDFYLRPKVDWVGEAFIAEPEKCDDLQLFSIDVLPGTVLSNVKIALAHISKGLTFSEYIEQCETSV